MKLRLRKGLVFKVTTAMVAIGALSFIGTVTPSNSSMVFADAEVNFSDMDLDRFGGVFGVFEKRSGEFDQLLFEKVAQMRPSANPLKYNKQEWLIGQKYYRDITLEYDLNKTLEAIKIMLSNFEDAVDNEAVYVQQGVYNFFFEDNTHNTARIKFVRDWLSSLPTEFKSLDDSSDQQLLKIVGRIKDCLKRVDRLWDSARKGRIRTYSPGEEDSIRNEVAKAKAPVKEGLNKPAKEETKAVSKPVKEETKAPAKKGLNKPAEENEDMSTDVSTDMSDDDILATLNKVSGDNDEEMVDIGPTRSEINANGFGSRVEEVYDGEEKLEDYVNYQQIEQVQAAVLRKAIKYCKTVLEMIAKGMSAYAGNNKTLSDPNSTYGIEMTTKSKDVLDKLEQITEKLDMRESGNVSQLPGIVKGLATDMTASVFLMQKRVKMLDAKIKEMEKMDDPDGKIREKIRRVKYDRKLLNMLKVYYGDLMLNLFINSNVREQFKVRGDKKDTGKALSILKEACDISELENLKEVNAAEADFNDKFGAFKKQVNGVHKTFVKKVQKLIDEKQEILSRDRIAKRQAGVEEARKRIKSNSAKFKRRTKRSASVRSPENRISLSSGSAGAPAKKLAIKKPALVGVSRGKVAVTQPDGSKKVVKTLM